MAAAPVNQLHLCATLSEVAALRFTPAGLPALDLQLDHESTIDEAGQARQVKAGIKAVTFGAVAERLARQPLGSRWQFSGFLSSGRGGKQIVFHIQEFETHSS